MRAQWNSHLAASRPELSEGPRLGSQPPADAADKPTMPNPSPVSGLPQGVSPPRECFVGAEAAVELHADRTPTRSITASRPAAVGLAGTPARRYWLASPGTSRVQPSRHADPTRASRGASGFYPGLPAQRHSSATPPRPAPTSGDLRPRRACASSGPHTFFTVEQLSRTLVGSPREGSSADSDCTGKAYTT